MPTQLEQTAIQLQINQDLNEWYLLKDQLVPLAIKEKELRSKIFKAAFPEAKEGTNKYDLGSGYILKAVYPITRDIDVALLDTYKEKLAENHISEDKLIKRVPKLETKFYKCLTKEELKLVDQFLIIKGGSPQMDIIAPKK